MFVGAEMIKKDYVLGFMFSPDMERVVLLIKTKPEFQKGKLNGVGGKIEDGESPLKAMVREFQEETGLDTEEKEWTYCGKFTEVINTDILYSGQANIYVYKCISDKGSSAESLTEEVVGNFKVSYLKNLPLMKSLNWIIPLLQYEQKTNFDVVFF